MKNIKHSITNYNKSSIVFPLTGITSFSCICLTGMTDTWYDVSRSVNLLLHIPTLQVISPLVSVMPIWHIHVNDVIPVRGSRIHDLFDALRMTKLWIAKKEGCRDWEDVKFMYGLTSHSVTVKRYNLTSRRVRSDVTSCDGLTSRFTRRTPAIRHIHVKIVPFMR